MHVSRDGLMREKNPWKVPVSITSEYDRNAERCISAPPLLEFQHSSVVKSGVEHSNGLGSKKNGWNLSNESRVLPRTAQPSLDRYSSNMRHDRTATPPNRKTFHLADTISSELRNSSIPSSASGSSIPTFQSDVGSDDARFSETPLWSRAFDTKYEELQQALREVEWARQKADVLIQHKVAIASQMKEAFRAHVSQTRHRLRTELDKFKDANVEHLKEEAAVRRRLTKARIHASVQARQLQHLPPRPEALPGCACGDAESIVAKEAVLGHHLWHYAWDERGLAAKELAQTQQARGERGASGGGEAGEAVEVQRSLGRVQRQLSRRQTDLSALRSQIAQCVSEVRRSKAQLEELALQPLAPLLPGRAAGGDVSSPRSPVTFARPRLPARHAAAAATRVSRLSLAPLAPPESEGELTGVVALAPPAAAAEVGWQEAERVGAVWGGGSEDAGSGSPWVITPPTVHGSAGVVDGEVGSTSEAAEASAGAAGEADGAARTVSFISKAAAKGSFVFKDIESLLCRDLRLSGFRSPAFVSDKLRAARREMLVGRGWSNSNWRSLAPVARALSGPALPRFFRGDAAVDAEPPAHADSPRIRRHQTLAEAKNKYLGLGMSWKDSVVLGQNVRSGEVGDQKVDGATGMSTIFAVIDSPGRVGFVEMGQSPTSSVIESSIGDSLTWSDEEDSIEEHGDHVERLLCRDIRSAGFISPAFCSPELRNARRTMLIGNRRKHRALHDLLPVARNMIQACCPRFLRWSLREDQLNTPTAGEDDVDDEDDHENQEVFARRRARFEGLGMSNAGSLVLGEGVQSGEVGALKVDGATGMCTVHVVGEAPLLWDVEEDEEDVSDFSEQSNLSHNIQTVHSSAAVRFYRALSRSGSQSSLTPNKSPTSPLRPLSASISIEDSFGRTPSTDACKFHPDLGYVGSGLPVPSENDLFIDAPAETGAAKLVFNRAGVVPVALQTSGGQVASVVGTTSERDGTVFASGNGSVYVSNYVKSTAACMFHPDLGYVGAGMPTTEEEAAEFAANAADPTRHLNTLRLFETDCPPGSPAQTRNASDFFAGEEKHDRRKLGGTVSSAADLLKDSLTTPNEPQDSSTNETPLTDSKIGLGVQHVSSTCLFLPDLGNVLPEMPTEKAVEFVANASDPIRSVQSNISVAPSENTAPVKREQHYVTSTESCMFHPDLGFVGAGMPTTDVEAAEFAANAADPIRHIRRVSMEATQPFGVEKTEIDSSRAELTYVTTTDACMFHPDLGYVGSGMPTTETEAAEFAANAADPLRSAIAALAPSAAVKNQEAQYVTSTDSYLGFVGAGMPTTDEEAVEFALNAANPLRHINSIESDDTKEANHISAETTKNPIVAENHISTKHNLANFEAHERQKNDQKSEGFVVQASQKFTPQQYYVTSTESCMFHPDLGFVGAGMPTTEKEAQEFAANAADPINSVLVVASLGSPLSAITQRASNFADPMAASDRQVLVIEDSTHRSADVDEVGEAAQRPAGNERIGALRRLGSSGRIGRSVSFSNKVAAYEIATDDDARRGRRRAGAESINSVSTSFASDDEDLPNFDESPPENPPSSDGPQQASTCAIVQRTSEALPDLVGSQKKDEPTNHADEQAPQTLSSLSDVSASTEILPSSPSESSKAAGVYYVTSTESCMFHPDLGFVGGGMPTTEAEAAEFAANAADPLRHIKSGALHVDVGGGRRPSQPNLVDVGIGAGAGRRLSQSGTWTPDEKNSAASSRRKISFDGSDNVEITAGPGSPMRMRRGSRRSLVPNLSGSPKPEVLLEIEDIMCRDFRLSGFRCPAFVSDKLRSARQRMLLSRGWINWSTTTLLPVSRDLMGISMPQYFRPELLSEPARAAYDDDVQSLRARFEGLGMSGVRSVVLGANVMSGAVDDDKVDGATGMSAKFTVGDEDSDDELWEPAVVADDLIFMDEADEEYSEVPKTVERLLCRDVRSSGFISPGFCSKELQAERRLMLLGRNWRRSSERQLLPVARALMRPCCPRYLRSQLLEDEVKPSMQLSSVKGIDGADDNSEEALARRMARFEGLGMSSAGSAVLGVGVQAGAVDDKRRIDGTTGMSTNRVIKELSEMNTLIEDEEDYITY